MLRAISIVLAVVLATMVALAQQSQRVDDNALRSAANNGEEWLTYGRDYAETRYSPLRLINATNASRLGLAWSYEVGLGGGNQEGTPLVANGVMYGVTNWSIVFALNARTGQELWRWDPQVNRTIDQQGSDQICCGVVNRGLALFEGKLIVPVIDGKLVALDT
jgi:quinohemoprotein ethanol dehydrogenase